MKFPKSPPWLIELFDAVQPEVGGTRKNLFEPTSRRHPAIAAAAAKYGAFLGLEVVA